MILTRLRHAWLVLTGRMLIIDHSIRSHIDLAASDLTQDVKDILMSLADNITALGASIEATISAAKLDASNANASLTAAQASEAAAITKANDLQSQLDAAQAAVNALHAQFNPPAAV